MNPSPTELARMIAVAAVCEPYRQLPYRALATTDFASWLRDRDLEFRPELLHHLWRVGILRAIAVRGPAATELHDAARARLVPLDTAGMLLGETQVFADLGVAEPVWEDLSAWTAGALAPPMPGGVRTELLRSLVWHPFQLPLLEDLAAILSARVGPWELLRGPAELASSAESWVESARRRLMGFAQEAQPSFTPVLALLLLAEPLVHFSLMLEESLNVDETPERYAHWREQADGAAFLEKVGLTRDEALARWEGLALRANLQDPLANLRPLLRRVDHDKRERLRGVPLRCHTLYDTAEILRHYLESYQGCTLLEEDDVRSGPPGAEAKRRLYGARRVGTYDRAVLRRITRHFGVDPSPRVICFVEGATEAGFLERFCERYYTLPPSDLGIELVVVGGSHKLEQTDAIRTYALDPAVRQEVFCFIALDQEMAGTHAARVAELGSQGRLPAGFRLWQSDFEEANFTFEELTEVANSFAADLGCLDAATLSVEEIRATMQRGKVTGRAIADLWKARCTTGARPCESPPGKGRRWGAALADWALDHECPPDRATSSGVRPMIEALLTLINSSWADYEHTAMTTAIDKDGNIVARPNSTAEMQELELLLKTVEDKPANSGEEVR